MFFRPLDVSNVRRGLFLQIVLRRVRGRGRRNRRICLRNGTVRECGSGQYRGSGERRRRGVGKKLLKKLETEAKERGARVILLEVRVSNAPAMTMYLKEGFKGIYVRPRYYPDGEDAVVMQKEL